MPDQEKLKDTDPHRKPRQLCRSPGLRARLRFLEYQLRDEQLRPNEHASDEEWLLHLRAGYARGQFRHEPDFPAAVAAVEAAVAEARTDPEYLPPPEFMPHATETRRHRNWHELRPHLKVSEASLWLCAIAYRAVNGDLPLSLTEWHFLKDWLQENRRVLRRLEERRRSRGPQHWSEGGDDVSVDGLWDEVKTDDGKQMESHKWAAKIRVLYARYAARLKRRKERKEAEGKGSIHGQKASKKAV